MNNLSNSSERHIALVSEALTPSTRPPRKPADRLTTLHTTAKKWNGFSDTRRLDPYKRTDPDFNKLSLYRSLIIMIGSFLERSPKKDLLKRPDIREFISHMEICLGLRSGKLTTSQLGNLLIKLDTIAPYKDGELTEDLEALDAAVQAYGDKLAGEQDQV